MEFLITILIIKFTLIINIEFFPGVVRIGPKSAILLNYYYYGFITSSILPNKFKFYKFYYIIENKKILIINNLEISFLNSINIII